MRIAAGETAAFEELFTDQSRILMAVIVRIVKSRSLAEEVLQECFTEVWTRCSGFDPARGTGRAWLITLCRRRAIDCVRSVQSQQDRDLADGLRSTAATGDDVEQTVIDRAESDRTVSALKGLPEDQSRPIVMAFYQGLTHAQISQTLKVPLGTIKSRIRDGMKKLREELEASR
ncbi:sigma-70 family RNA polymerase sigma factor [Brevibacterium sp. GP-SGM9]|uniref:sigma-70 family RNA polymerase sigma factor n=1 Tax=Brevibacterium sp. GP-SGM9 TaxID=3376990 RepID=UPI0039A57A8E